MIICGKTLARNFGFSSRSAARGYSACNGVFAAKHCWGRVFVGVDLRSMLDLEGILLSIAKESML